MLIRTCLPLGVVLLTWILQCVSPVLSVRHYSKEKMLKLREDVREMFQHAYEGYLRHAGNYDELRPLTCDGIDTWGSYSLSLIDSLSTLAAMGNFSEFRRVTHLLERKMNFDKDINVSVFETNIRIVGGLLAAHVLSKKAGVHVEKGWPCVGPLLRLAEDMAKRLLPAFNTRTGMPYGTVNLRHGVPKGETPITCTATIGTLLVEFGTLSRLTGNPIYEEVAMNAIYALWERRSPLGLFGNHIDVQTGRWTALDAGIGAGVDSFFEYLVKGSILLNRPELLQMFHEARVIIDKYMKRDDWYVWVGMNKGQVTLPVFQSLEAFWPGVLSIIGDTRSAIKTFAKYSTVWRKYGFLPEFYNIPADDVSPNRASYPLRPELAESAMYLYRATGNEFLLEIGEDMMQSIQFSARTKCGFSTIRNVVTHEKENRMESFFLSETTKYLYLLFDEDNFLHNDGRHGELLDTPNGQCVINSGAYIFNTEAHPIDMSALWCCHDIHEDFLDALDMDQFDANVLMKADRQKRLDDEAANPKYQCGDPRGSPKLQQEHTKESGKSEERKVDSGLSVDIEVFDEDNNLAGDLLVENFERVRKESQQQQEDQQQQRGTNQAEKNSTDDDRIARNQLTVTDLEEYFSVQRAQFKSAHAFLNYTVTFMRNFTLDPGYIRGLQIFDQNVSTVLGTLVQKEYEAHTRSLWELYTLYKQYAINAVLVLQMGILNFDHENHESLDLIIQALAYDEMDEHDPANAESLPFAELLEKMHEARLKYAIALVNVTAMQEFLHKIFVNGTEMKKLIFKPMLNEEESKSLQSLEAMNTEIVENLFAQARKVVEVRKRMIDTFAKLQKLIEDGDKTKNILNDDNSKMAKQQKDGDDDDTTKKAQAPAQNPSEQVDTIKTIGQRLEAKSTSDDENSTSIWSQLVETILRKTTIHREKFDEQALLERTQKALKGYTVKTPNYEVFSCQQPKFIDTFAYRLSYL